MPLSATINRRNLLPQMLPCIAMGEQGAKMAQNKLTEPKCRTSGLKPGQTERFVGDGDGLFLRLRRRDDPPRTVKTWVFWYSLHGQRGKQGLGVYPDVGLAKARHLAQESRKAVADGRDPVAAKEATERAQAAQLAAQQARPTVLGLFERWHEQEASKRKDKGEEVRRAMEKDVIPLIGKLYADEVRRRDVMHVLDTVKKRGVKRYANYLLQYLRQMFKFAVLRDITTSDPTFGIEKKDVGGREKERDRILTEAEIHELAQKLPISGLTPMAQAAFWLIFATCCRVGELTKARWSEFDEEQAIWTIPAANSKNGREHLIHLSPFALKQLKALSQNATSKTWAIARAAFRKPRDPDEKPETKADAHANTKSLQKQFRDRQRKQEVKGRSKQLGALALKSGPWTAHDLRRTGATIMGELGVRSDVIDRVLNHIEPKKVTRTYQRQELHEERAQAFNLLGDRLELLIREKPSNVVRGKFRKIA